MQVMRILDGRIFNANDILETPDSQMDTRVAFLGDSSYTFGQIVEFSETASIPFSPDTLVMVHSTIDLFLDNAAMDYEAARLELRDDEFRRILEEFRDGLLLFKLMEDSVWTAAASDTAALMAYHEPRAESYQFPDRTRIVSLRSRSDSLMTAFHEQLETGTSLEALIEDVVMDTTMAVRIDTTYLAEPNNSVFDRALSLGAGKSTAPILNTGSYLVLVNNGVESAHQKTFAEARSEVVNAYQDVLEAQMLTRHHDRYGTIQYPERLSPAFAAEKKAAAEAPDLMDDEESPFGTN
jgi:peptidyl-prolyl cis-trans isomerase SurA